MSSTQTTKPFSLDALRQGDRAEFSRLVDANYEMIYRLAIRMVNNPQDAEDILQETFLKAYRHLKTFDGRSSLSTWLYRIATNEALMFIRRQKAGQISIEEPIETDDFDQVPLQIVDWGSLPESELLSTEAMEYLNKAVENLSPSLRVVFILRDIRGLSTREASEVLEISETAVKTRLSRARLRLRDELSNYYGVRIKEGDGV